jgi:hypothetical protein
MGVPGARRWAAAGALALALALACPDRARGEPGAEGDAPAPEATQPIALDRLLKLPTGSDYGVERRGGLTRGEWRQRFAQVDGALEVERRGLAAAQGELDQIAGSADQWLVGPPGTTNTDAPLDYRLRMEIGRRKEEIERLEKNRKALEVEANLAGVPDEWRE